MDDIEIAITSHRHTEKTKRVQLVYLKRITFLVFFLCVMETAQCQLYKNCNSNGEFKACFPSAERILQSNPTQLQVDPPDVTCGLQVQESYLRLGDTTFRQYFCNPGQHVKEKMIDEDPLNTWWQSKTWTVGQYDTTLPNPQYAINVTLSIKKKYRMSQNITITFNSGRPQEMVIEKSSDQGQTWQTLQYYARDCSADYPEAPSSYLSNLTAVICTEVYSKDTSNPQSGLKVYFPGSSERMKTYTTMQYYTEMENKDMQNFLIFTDIRLRLLFPATDSRERSRRPEDFLKYYYAISDIDITGSCFCNLHSGGCITDPATNDTVCDCSHNTEGVDCERCKPLYNNRPWREGSFLPARVGEANACEKCECHDHATSCTYNATYDEGVCDDCTHNTTGRHCDRCLDGFFPDISLPLNHSAVCSPCDCEVMGLLSPTDASCLNDRTAPDVGHCTCKNLVTGRRCDQCVDGYFGLLDPATPGTCKLCGCQVFGTEANSGACDQTSGQCQCKSSIQGRICDSCKDGYYSFPTLSSEECDPCGCDSGGSASHTCDEFGICTCIPHVIGDKCNQVEPNFYIPSLDEFIKQPTGGTCTVAGDLWTTSNPFDGDVFATCPPGVSSEVEFEDLNGNDQQLELRWPYFVGIRYTLLGTEGRYGGNLDIEVTRNSDIDVNQFAVDGNIPESACPTTFGTTYSTQLNFSVGVSASVLGETSFMFDRRCIYTIKLTLPSQINSTDILVDSAIFMPDLSNTENGAAFITLSNSTDPNTVISTYNNCKAQLSSLISRQTAMSSTQCRELLWSIASEIHKEGKPCNCDQMGSTLTTCQHFGGKCTCKFGVGGRSCNKCLPGYFNMTVSGCTQCPEMPCPVLQTLTTIKSENMGNNSAIEGYDESTPHLTGIFIAIGLLLTAIFLTCIAFMIFCPEKAIEKLKCFRNMREREAGRAMNVGSPGNLGSRDPRNGDGVNSRVSWMMQDSDEKCLPIFPSVHPDLSDGSDLPTFYLGQGGSPFASKSGSFSVKSDTYSFKTDPETRSISVINVEPGIDFSRDCEVDIIPPPPSFNTFKSDNPITLPAITLTKALPPKKPKRKTKPETMSDKSKNNVDNFKKAVDENIHNENILLNQKLRFAVFDQFDEVNGSFV